MSGSAHDPQVVTLAVVLAIAAIAFRRALLRIALAILALIALVLVGSGAMALAGLHW